MKLGYLGIGLLLLQVACSGSPPAATEYKKQLGAVGGSGGGGGGGGGADATAGKAFLKSNCETCHKPDGSSQIPLSSSEVEAIKGIAAGTQTVDGHGQSITDSIKKNEANIVAALGGSSGGGAGGGGSGGGTAGNVQTGLQIVTTTCSNCHGQGKAQAALTKASAGGVEAAGKRPSHTTVAASFAQSADIIAYLNSL